MRIIEEFVLPVLVFGFVLYVSLWYLKNALPIYRDFRRNGRSVHARVTGFKATKLGIKNSDKFFVYVEAVPPDGDTEKSYVLSTCHHKGKRYSKVTECKVIFVEGDPIPVLKEEVRLWRRDIIISFVGVFLSLLMISLYIFAAADKFFSKTP